MNTATQGRLGAAGFRVGTTAEFLNLTAEEQTLVDLRLALGASLKRRRQEHGMTQAVLAGKIHSSQSRVAKMEAGDPGVSLDLLVHALLATGATRTELAALIAAP